ncbi:histidine phosphatase family protein [Actinomadura alba]|uniref:Histidine phosphatase family protein n=1 Tax=Actinomadura alba TaxID=406431 RepID=A0ABR7LKW8_9ACTN|nr:histidine phosphatase family protein [Actinomadura alba]
MSRNVVGLTPLGFRQSVWLGEALADLNPKCVFTCTYRRSIDTAAITFPDLPEGRPRRTALLDEQHYGDATYPNGAEDRRTAVSHRTCRAACLAGYRGCRAYRCTSTPLGGPKPATDAIARGAPSLR